MFVFSHFYGTDFPAHFWINPCSIETNAKETEEKKKKTLLEFPDHIYSELTDIAFPSFQALINSLLKGKKKKKERERERESKKKIDEE